MLFKIGTIIAFALLIAMLLMMGLYYFILIQHLLHTTKKSKHTKNSKQPFKPQLITLNKKLRTKQHSSQIQLVGNDS